MTSEATTDPQAAAIASQGVLIPRLGLGTFRMPSDICRQAVESALDVGYRHIDTAAMYDNERAVGAAVRASRLPRHELFVTSKVWHDQLAPNQLKDAHAATLDRLGLEYTDLYLIHWPNAAMDMREVLDSLVEIRELGRTRAIGVCNFNMPMLRQAIENLKAPIATVQMEYHAYLSQDAVLAFLDGHGIPLTAYAPLAQGRLAREPILQSIAAKHNATASQIALAWILLRPTTIVIPKAQHAGSQAANLRALGIRLDADDIAAIEQLPKNRRFVSPAFAPDWGATVQPQS